MTVKYDREQTLPDAIAAAGASTDTNVVPWKEKGEAKRGIVLAAPEPSDRDSGATLAGGSIGDRIAHGNPFHARGEATADSIEGEVVVSLHHRRLWLGGGETPIAVNADA